MPKNVTLSKNGEKKDEFDVNTTPALIHIYIHCSHALLMFTTCFPTGHGFNQHVSIRWKLKEQINQIQYIMLKDNTAKTYYFKTNTSGQHLHISKGVT